jgi:hypothetical protein
MNTSKMTTKQLKDELENIKRSFDYTSETWERIFAIEEELKKRKAIQIHTYNLD